MNRLIFISAVCMQIGWISGVPTPNGVGAYAYQDSNGRRYGGTYNLNGEHATLGSQDSPGLPGGFPVRFGSDFDEFFPEYFRNFENLLQDRRARSLIGQPPCRLRPLPPLRPLRKRLFEPLPALEPMCPLSLRNRFNQPFPTLPSLFHRRAFDSNKENQRKALQTAKKAYDITSNQAGFMPNIDFSRFSPFGASNFNNFGMPNAFGGPNAAMALGVAAPGFTHQFAGLSPPNPNNPNIDVSSRFAETGPSNGFMSVSSSSFSSSSNLNGKQENHRTAETLVNNNGKVSHYKVED